MTLSPRPKGITVSGEACMAIYLLQTVSQYLIRTLYDALLLFAPLSCPLLDPDLRFRTQRAALSSHPL